MIKKVPICKPDFSAMVEAVGSPYFVFLNSKPDADLDDHDKCFNFVMLNYILRLQGAPKPHKPEGPHGGWTVPYTILQYINTFKCNTLVSPLHLH